MSARIYTPEECEQIGAAFLAASQGKPTQYFNPNRNPDLEWFDHHCPEPEHATYELVTSLRAGYLIRAKPEPILKPWSKPEHVPGPVCWLKLCGISAEAHLVIQVTGEYIHAAGICRVRWGELWSNTYYSTDRRNWHPCVITE